MRRCWLLLVGLWIVMWPHQVAQAAGAGFSVASVLPANQIEPTQGYFDLLVTPGSQQKLTLRIENQTATSKVIHVAPINAYTKDNGQVAYSPNTKRDDSAQYQLTQLTAGGVDVLLAGHEGKPVTFTVQIPESGFEGQILGGFYAQDQKAYGDEAASGLTLNNRFAMVVAVQLQTATTLVAPHLNLVAVKTGTQAGQAAVLATLQNDRPRLFGQLAITASVTQRNSTTVVARRSVKDYAMAPNSRFAFAVFPKAPLRPGAYVVKLKATAAKHTWRFTRNFTVSAEAASTANAALPEAPRAPFAWLWVAIGGLGGLVLVLLGLLWRQKRQAQGG